MYLREIWSLMPNITSTRSIIAIAQNPQYEEHTHKIPSDEVTLY